MGQTAVKAHCEACGDEFDDRAQGTWREVRGWTVVRSQGGANAVRDRRETGRALCPRCGTARDLGIDPAQVDLFDQPEVEPTKVAEHLLARLVEHDDDMGDLANSRADDLRDALRLAVDEIRVRRGSAPRSAWLHGARRLVVEVYRLVQAQTIDARSPAADAALDMRDVIDVGWWPLDDVEAN